MIHYCMHDAQQNNKSAPIIAGLVLVVRYKNNTLTACFFYN